MLVGALIIIKIFAVITVIVVAVGLVAFVVCEVIDVDVVEYKIDGHIMRLCEWYIMKIRSTGHIATFAGRTYHKLAQKWDAYDKEVM